MCYKVLFFACGVLLLCMFGCSKDSVSENEMPTLTVDEASAISRKTAVISGSISVPEGTEIKSCGFLYSTVSSLPETDSKVVSVILKGLSNTYETTLTGLRPILSIIIVCMPAVDIPQLGVVYGNLLRLLTECLPWKSQLQFRCRKLLSLWQVKL